jgi:hypothetical protein
VIATERPSAPTCCGEPGCAHDPRAVVDHDCGCAVGYHPTSAAPTVPVARPCQENALVEALLRRDAAVDAAGRAAKQLDWSQYGRAMRRYEAERARLAALTAADGAEGSD